MSARIDLGGTVALVTGASRGLGRSIALALGEAGADLALAARNREDLERTAADAAKHGVRAEIFLADLTAPAAIEALVADAERAFGRVDVLVNNAGIAGREVPVHELSAEDWDRVLAVNLRAPALCAGAVARGMIARRRGRIVNVASIGGLTPLARMAPYCAAKAGLVQLTRVMALELARHGVQVNCVCPGYFATPMNEEFFATRAGQDVIQRSIPMRRLGEPAELAPAVVLLASDGASFMTGSVVVVDGGHTLT
ncbi:MAG: SDR family oxidoreductase [Candidatus Rokubacteria bacterium]|nr:SDR family oxidoreductase [Candidatus Rokubacteria bacterium]